MGALLQWLINTWLNITGKPISFEKYPWLRGPYSETDEVGLEFYRKFAEKNQLSIQISEDFDFMKRPHNTNWRFGRNGMVS